MIFSTKTSNFVLPESVANSLGVEFVKGEETHIDNLVFDSDREFLHVADHVDDINEVFREFWDKHLSEKDVGRPIRVVIADEFGDYFEVKMSKYKYSYNPNFRVKFV